MADLYTFSMLLTDVAPDIVEIDGRIFLDRDYCGISALSEKVRAYPSAFDAQKWINLVPIDNLLDLAVDDWSMDDPAIEAIAEVYRRSWLAIAARALGREAALSVDLLKDKDSGDLILRLAQHE